MVTIRDVAERAGVSLGTASRVLNGNPTVRPQVREAVEIAIRELNYVPNAAARTLRSTRTRTIGVILPDLLNPMTVRLLRGVEDAAEEAGYTILVTESRLDERLEGIHINNLINRQVDGLLCSPVGSTASIGRIAESSGVPTVLVQLRRPAHELPTIFVDERRAVADAMSQLASAGHRRIALAHSPSRSGGGRHRRDLIRSERARHSLDNGPELDVTFAGSRECFEAVRALLQSADRPTALIVGVHEFVPAALSAINAEGMQVGADVSLVVFGDSDWARAMSPALSVVVVDQEAHARAAVCLLLETLSAPTGSPRGVRTESVFINRESIGPVTLRKRNP